jgi:hypothetical protein
MYPMIDQSAHMGGLFAGAAIGALLSRKWPVASAGWMRGLVTALAATAVGSLLYGAIGAATGDFADTLASYPRVKRELAGLELAVPATWKQVSKHQLDDDTLAFHLFLVHRTDGPFTPDVIEARLNARVELERTEVARELGMERVRQVQDRMLHVPPPWLSVELAGDLDADAAGGQAYRIAVVARPYGSDLWLGSIYYPASLGDDLSPLLADVLGAARPAAAK